jgi:hypothetical protein
MEDPTPLAPSTPAEPADREPALDRRELLQGLAATGMGAALRPWMGSAAGLAEGAAGLGGLGEVAAAGGLAGCRPAVARPGLIAAENASPGTTDWMLQNTRVDPAARFRCPWIEGYCSATSVRAGDRLAIMVSTDPPSPFVIDIYRMGWYGGAGGRHMTRLGPFQGQVQPLPEIGVERVRDCRWQPAVEITIPAAASGARQPDGPAAPGEWPSGVYLGKLTAERGGLQSYVVFVVRDDRPCDVLFQCSSNTWAAYNRWPTWFSLYDNGQKVWYWGPDVRVSWNRPYGKYCQLVDAPLSQGSGEFLLWEFPAAFWLEQQGFDVSYTANADTHADGAGIQRAKLWLSVGHDEYWSLDMHRHVMAARDAGVNLAFLSGNACYGVVDYHADALGRELRAIRRIGQYGPIDPRVVAEEFPELRALRHNGPDESRLIGARSGYPLTGTADWICTRSTHWIFEHTGMRDGDRIPGLVGWEFHGNPAPLPGLEVVAAGPLDRWGSGPGYAATVYPGPKGNFVFNGATCWWSNGLSAPPGHVRPGFRRIHPEGPDRRVQRITANLIRRACRV